MADIEINVSLIEINQKSHTWMDQNKTLIIAEGGRRFLFKNNANGQIDQV